MIDKNQSYKVLGDCNIETKIFTAIVPNDMDHLTLSVTWSIHSNIEFALSGLQCIMVQHHESKVGFQYVQALI